MNMILQELLRDAASRDQESQKEAILQLAMLLEKHSSKPDSSVNYQHIMPAQLQNLSLTRDEQQGIMAALSDLLVRDGKPPSLLWALGKSTDCNALIPLLAFLNRNCVELGEETTWQALAAIDNFLVFGDDGRLDSEALRILSLYDPTSCLHNLAENSCSDIKDLAQRMLRKIRNGMSAHDPTDA